MRISLVFEGMSCLCTYIACRQTVLRVALPYAFIRLTRLKQFDSIYIYIYIYIYMQGKDTNLVLSVWYFMQPEVGRNAVILGNQACQYEANARK
jgi:hypothetical protein